jgi:hypothetical protein
MKKRLVLKLTKKAEFLFSEMSQKDFERSRIWTREKRAILESQKRLRDKSSSE